MSGSLRNLLQDNYAYLVEELMVPIYLDLFYSKGILTSDEKEELACMTKRREQTRTFVDSLMRKGEEKIGRFLEIVKKAEDKQPHIYSKLLVHASATSTSENGDHPGNRGCDRSLKDTSGSGIASIGIHLNAEISPLQMNAVSYVA